MAFESSHAWSCQLCPYKKPPKSLCSWNQRNLPTIPKTMEFLWFPVSMAMQQEPIEDGGTDSIYFWPIFQASISGKFPQTMALKNGTFTYIPCIGSWRSLIEITMVFVGDISIVFMGLPQLYSYKIPQVGIAIITYSPYKFPLIVEKSHHENGTEIATGWSPTLHPSPKAPRCRVTRRV